MPAHAYEFTLDPAGDAEVRAVWARLADVGLPSRADHTGATNAPHVTLAAAPTLEGSIGSSLPDLRLPVEADLPGLLVLEGTSARSVLAFAVALPAAALAACAAIRTRALPVGLSSQPWIPHLTVSGRLRPDQLDAAIGAVLSGPRPSTARLTALRWWDPSRAVVTPISG